LPDIGSQTSPLDGFLARYPDTRAVDAFTFDLCGRPSGKRYAIDDAPKLFSDSGMAMCAAITLLDASGNTSDPLGYGVSDGDPDALCRPIAGTLAPVPWASAPTAQVMLEMLDPHTRAPIPFEPRRVLTRVLERFRELNLTPVVAIELEFFLIDKDLTPEGGPLPARSPRTGRPVNANNVYGMDALEDFAPVLSAITEACAAQGIPASVLSGEFAPGQFELNLRHVADPLAAADHACLLRRAVLGTARAQGMDATFLSKPFPDSSGSGLHVHLSFQDASGVNILDDALDPEEKTLRHVMAGLAAAMPESMAFLAPNLNAFSTLQAGPLRAGHQGLGLRQPIPRLSRSIGTRPSETHRASGRRRGRQSLSRPRLRAGGCSSRPVSPLGAGDQPRATAMSARRSTPPYP
jgi:glutamine synthetase